MYDALRSLLLNGELPVVERFETPAQAARYGQIPQFLFDSDVGTHLQGRLKDNRLWAHQAQALEALGREDNVVVSTSTASGKSLIFQSLAFHKVLLDPENRVLVFYPLKALAADQIRGWQAMAHALGLDDGSIGRIDGSVPFQNREDILHRARIVVMTPDVCHAWLMSRLALPVIKDFVRALSTVVMDEAHTLEGVFGSNFAFLIRRLIAVRNHLVQDKATIQALQLVAATATIKDPGEHMRKLTGSKFSVVDHEANGAPHYERLVAHIACPAGEEARFAKVLHDHVLNTGREGGFITFLDSRKGVEALAMASGASDHADVLPYRAGYDSQDRQKIERRLQVGNLRGVVSTSALELGIDIPHLRIGFNIGVPSTRKAYRQRLGRVGRSGPGVFVVIAPPDEFRRYGTSFHQYHEMSVEPSYLYLDNRFMQFAHGRCLALELESLAAPSETPTRVAWPQGFSDRHAAARPGGNRPLEFDAIAALGGDTPHYGYPLRNVGEVNFQIKMNPSASSFGDVSQLQALRECYPGAVYLHLAKAYKVAAWHTNSFESFIRVRHGAPGRSTRPRISTWVNAGLTAADTLDGHVIRSESGFLAECQMQITEKVEGYIDERTGQFHSYQELQQRNPNMRARSRNFRTSGVVLFIGHSWFKGSVKKAFADRLREVFVREYSIAPQDIGSAASNISIRNPDSGGWRGRCIAIYDETYGSLRFTERLYLNFEHILDRLIDAVASDSGDDEDTLKTVLPQIREEVAKFDVGGVVQKTTVAGPVGYDLVFTEGSRVCRRQGGQMAVEVKIIQPTVWPDGNLMYQVEIPQRLGQQPVKQWIPATAIEPSADADAWTYAWWNRATETYEERPDTME